MAKKRYINTKFWSDNYIVDLEPLERYLFLYFLTNEHTDICGIYELPKRIMAFETGLDIETISNALERFSNDRKIQFIDGWVYVHNFTKNQASNENMVKGATRSLEEVPAQVMAKIKEITESSESLSKPSESFGKPRLTLTLTPKPTEDMSDKSDVQAERLEDFDYFWEAYPKKELKRKAKEIWLRKKLSAQLKAILSFVEQAKQTDRWQKGYIKQPTAFLNGECWNDDLNSYNDKKAKQGIAIIS